MTDEFRRARRSDLHLVASPTVTPQNCRDSAALFEAGWRWCATGQQWYLVWESPAGDLACKCGVPAPPPEVTR